MNKCILLNLDLFDTLKLNMTNLFALCLIITSLTAAGVWSPSPASQQDQDHEQNVIVKGHRVVVVEYGDQGQHNTKVSISSEPSEDSERHRTRGLICDAFGKCKHKIASAVEKAAKVMVPESVEIEKARDFKQGAKETLKEAMEKGRESDGNKLKENLMVIRDRGVKLVNRSIRYLGPVGSLKAAMDVLSLLGFAMALGMGVWTTFISSYVLASALPSQSLAVVQSKIYPVYFRAMASSIGMALFGHTQIYLLVAALLMIFVNSLYMEPQATKVMFERLKLEKEEGRGIEDITAQPWHVNDNPPATTTSTPSQVVDQELVKSKIVGLNKRLKKLNSYSSLLNLLTLMLLTWHLVYLSQRLRIPC